MSFMMSSDRGLFLSVVSVLRVTVQVAYIENKKKMCCCGSFVVADHLTAQETVNLICVAFGDKQNPQLEVKQWWWKT